MNPDPLGSLLAELRSRDVRLVVVGDRVRISAPKGVLSEGHREALRDHKPALRDRLERETQLLAMSLDRFEKQRCALELRVDWLEETIWWVPTAGDVAALLDKGIRRGRIWTGGELRDLASIPDRSQAEIRRLASLKAAFDAEVIEVNEHTGLDDVDPIHECECCRGTKFWRSIHGSVTCGICHPPAAPELVAEWIMGAPLEAPDA